MSLPRLLRTIRPLKASQLAWRLRYAVERRLPGRRPPAPSPVPPLAGDFPDAGVLPPPGPTASQAVEKLRRGVVEHLNQAVEIGREAPDWRLGPVRRDRLWTATLHYGAWAHALAEAGGEAEELLRHYLDDWLRRCGPEAPGASHLAWNAYAVATRLAWWTAAHRTARGAFRAIPDLERRFLGSLAQQARHLTRHLEWDLRGNHLVRDAVGLATAGRFFAGAEAEAWLARATELAVAQAAEQVLADGGHFERSPMYHAVVLEDFFVLTRLLRDPGAVAALGRTCAAMAEYLTWVRHGDGGAALLNDGGLGGRPPGELLELVGVDPGPRRGTRYFADSGLFVHHGDPWTVFFDVGEVGPGVQPGHAHADTLTIESSFRGRRLFVDPGTFAYDLDERRRYDRSTAAHNTVAVDGEDSSELWHVFRAGRRARPQGVAVAEDGTSLRAAAAHDGYRHLPGRPRVWRELTLDGDVLTLVDRVDGGGRHRVEGGLLVEPGWSVEAVGGGWRLVRGGARVRVTVEGPAGLALAARERAYHPDYGVELAAQRLGWSWEGPLPVEVRSVAAAWPR